MSFTKQMEDFASSATRSAERIVRQVTINLFSAIIRDTPVATGRLRGNWQCTLKSPAVGEVNRNGQDALSEVRAVIQGFSGDGVMILVNNLPYARVVEFGEYISYNAGGKDSKVTVHGFSKKAPEGMMGRNLPRFNMLLEEQVRNKK